MPPRVRVACVVLARTQSAMWQLNRLAMSQPVTSPIWPSVMRGLRGRCPHCGEGRLFAGFLSLRPKCESCGLDYRFADSGDGPAVFVILGAGFVVVFAALIVEVLYRPPFWLHRAERRRALAMTSPAALVQRYLTTAR